MTSVLTTPHGAASTVDQVATEPVVAVSRRRIDQVLIGLGTVFAVVLLVSGALLTWGSNFSHDYVDRELSSQNIFFPPTESLVEEGRDDLASFGDQQVLTGTQAEAYASYIDGHLDGIADGQTYADLGAPQRAARAELTAAKEAGESEATIADLQADVDAITAQRTSLFQGETLRGLLLSTYAWWQIGAIAGYAAIAAFIAAAVMVVLVVLGVVHMRRHRAATT
jgi:hypothetical protein